jgi:hypothetical protein
MHQVTTVKVLMPRMDKVVGAAWMTSEEDWTIFCVVSISQG